MHCTLTSTLWGLNYHVSLIRIMFLLAKPLRGLTGENWSNCSFFFFNVYVTLQLAPWSVVPSAFCTSRYCTFKNLFVWLICQNPGEVFLSIFLKVIPCVGDLVKKCHQFQLFCLKKEKRNKKDQIWDLKWCAAQNPFENKS